MSVHYKVQASCICTRNVKGSSNEKHFGEEWGATEGKGHGVGQKTASHGVAKGNSAGYGLTRQPHSSAWAMVTTKHSSCQAVVRGLVVTHCRTVGAALEPSVVPNPPLASNIMLFHQLKADEVQALLSHLGLQTA